METKIKIHPSLPSRDKVSTYFMFWLIDHDVYHDFLMGLEADEYHITSINDYFNHLTAHGLPFERAVSLAFVWSDHPLVPRHVWADVNTAWREEYSKILGFNPN